MNNKYAPTPVAFGQSCINMNTDFGCRNSCVYCFGQNWHSRDKIFRPKDMVQELPAEVTVPIGINNSASDPFQPGTAERTMELLELVQHRASRGVMLITKEYVSRDTVRFLESLACPVFVFVSYAGLPEEYERLVDDRRMETLANLYTSSVYSILYARPLIPGRNDFDKIRLAARYVRYGVWSSVRVDHNNAHDLLPEPTGENLHKSHKRVSDDELNLIEAELAEAYWVRFFRKTSCAISSILGIPDYNAHWVSPALYGCGTCAAEQRVLCISKRSSTPAYTDEVQNIIDTYRLPSYVRSVPGAFVLDSSDMKKFSCLRAGILRKLTGFQVLFDWEGELLTAENLAYRYYELRGEEEGNIPVKGVTA